MPFRGYIPLPPPTMPTHPVDDFERQFEEDLQRAIEESKLDAFERCGDYRPPNLDVIEEIDEVQENINTYDERGEIMTRIEIFRRKSDGNLSFSNDLMSDDNSDDGPNKNIEESLKPFQSM